MNPVSDEMFIQRLAIVADLVSAHLAEVLSETSENSGHKIPVRLIHAMQHGALNGGKRLRPFLVLESAAVFGVPAAHVLDVATALECIHCYSLIHDDLPSMDDDDLRRGKPTVHVAYDEATAILAGDALLTLAFDLITRSGQLTDRQKVELVSALSRAAGRGGMVGGQMLDLEHEHKAADAETITQIHAMKTGALLRFACEAGAICGEATADQRRALVRFGDLVGITFQLADDLLDVTASSDDLGKTAGKDATADKKTHIALYGLDWARNRLDELVGEAEFALAPFAEKATILAAAARFAAKRRS